MKTILYTKFSNERSKAFKIKTQIVEENGSRSVYKVPTCPEAADHILGLEDKFKALTRCYPPEIKVNKCKIIDIKAVFEYIEGITLAEKIDSLIDLDKTEQAIDEIKKFLNIVNNLKPVVRFEKTKDFICVFGDVDLAQDYECCNISNIDIVFNNVILNDGYNLLDYEWTFNFPVPLKFITYRCIMNFVYQNPARSVILDKGILDEFHIGEAERTQFDLMESNFQDYVTKGGFSTRAYYAKLNIKNFFLENIIAEGETDVDLTAEAFVDRGNGFELLRRFPDANSEDEGSISVDVDDEAELLRLDPITGVSVFTDVKIKAYTQNQEYEPIFKTNGYIYNESSFAFGIEDVQFIISLKKGTKKVTMTYCYNKAFMEAGSGASDVLEVLNDKLEEYTADLTKAHDIINEKDSLISEKDMLLEFRENRIKEQNAAIASASKVIKSQKNALAARSAELEYKERQINEIYSSTSWRITAPIRFIKTNTKKLFKNFFLTKKAYEFLHYIKSFGFKRAVSMHKKQAETKVQAPLGGISVDFDKDITPLETLDKTIAVHLHLYYADLTEEFFGYLNNIPYSFDLFISCKNKEEAEKSEKRFSELKNVKNVTARETINRGRDIAPLYVMFGDEIEKYDYFLHIHSKKSLFRGSEQYDWRRFNLDCLLKDSDTVKRIFSLFESNKKVGLFYPETLSGMHLITHNWVCNAGEGKKFLEDLGIEFDDCFFNYPVGSFFWARTDALKPIFEKKLRYEDFPEEGGQTDGTLAHVLERAVSFVSKGRGYIDAVYDLESGYVSLEKSHKIFRDYFGFEREMALMHLGRFELISFDIFGTLVASCAYFDDDIFEIMRSRFESMKIIGEDFAKMRKKAEMDAKRAKGEYVDIYDIYDELKGLLNISEAEAEVLLKLELDTVKELTVPREDMLYIFDSLKKQNKNIVLVEDSYYTSEMLSEILEKCGFTDFDDIWVSCEKGKGKVKDGIWKDFFEVYGGYNTVHVGDSAYQDIQLVANEGKNMFFVINPVDAFKMSRSYNELKKQTDGSLMERTGLGSFINAEVYNSPFVQKEDGEPDLSSFGCETLTEAYEAWKNRTEGLPRFLDGLMK